MSDVDSAAPHVADELLLYLDAQRDQMAALGKLPKHLRGVDLLTPCGPVVIIDPGP